MIEIGGKIGKGILMGQGKEVQMEGNQIMIIYEIKGLMMFLVMREMGEIMI